MKSTSTDSLTKPIRPASTLSDRDSALIESDSLSEQAVVNVKALFSDLSIDNIEDVRGIYTPDIVFVDPFAQINGIDKLVEYFSNHYENVRDCRFDYSEQIIFENRVDLEWTMSFSHPRLSGGRQIDVEGISKFVFEHDRVSFHRDYYDSSALIYQNVPVLGSVIKFIRGRLT